MSENGMTSEKARAALRPTRVWHPLLLSLCPVVGLFAHNAGRIPLDALVRPAAVYLGAAFATWLVFLLVCRNRFRAGLLTSLMLLAFVLLWGVLEDIVLVIVPQLAETEAVFFYIAYVALVLGGLAGLTVYYRKKPRTLALLLGVLAATAVVWFLTATLLLSPVFGRRAAWLITGYLLVFSGAVMMVARYRGDLKGLTKSANTFAWILLALYGAVFLLNFRSDPDIEPPPLVFEAQPRAQDALPDVYLLILDGYAREDVLRQGYGYNPMPFLSHMESLGFERAEQGLANYAGPLPSAVALLNMAYLEDLTPGEEPLTGGAATVLYHRNRFYGLMKEAGYRIIAFSPGVQRLEPRAPVDEVRAPAGALSEVEVVLLNRTVVARILQVVYYFRYDNPAYWRFEPRRERTLYTFRELQRLAAVKEDEPRLIVANMLLPSPPFLFTRTGERAQPFGAGSLAIDRAFRGTAADFRASYVGQVHFLNTSLADTARAIVENSERPAVVLVASATGSPAATRQDGDSGLPTGPERFATLLMARFPEAGGAAPLRDDISLVNYLRTAANRILGVDLEPLPDRVPTGQPPPGEAAAAE